MADPQIRLKRSTVAGKIPTTAQLALGELAVNAFDGEVFLKQDTAGVGIATRVIRVGAGGSLGKTIFVCKEGDDANTGLNEKDAKLTIKAAAEIAEIFDTVKVYPGVYVEQNPILLEKNVSVEGLELRNCIVSPANADKDLFHVNDGCHLTDLGFTGSMDSGSAAVAFRPLESVASDRYFDAARLIRVNSDFIAREAVGFLTSGYSGYAGTHLAQDGATALEANLDFIAQEAVGYITSTDYKNPAFVVTDAGGAADDPQNCRDDIKDIFKAIAYDLKSTGNLKSVGAALSYFSGGALVHVAGTDSNGYSIADATVAAIDRAAGIATYVINQRPWASVGAGGTTNVTGFDYDKLTGIATVTSVGHGVTTGDIVELVGLAFTCSSITLGETQFKITASDGAGSDIFGYSVAVGRDKIVVGASGDESATGAVYVYDLDGTNEIKITASDGASSDRFGASVAVGSNKIVVGAYRDGDYGTNSGSAYIYDLDGTNEVKINASDAASNDFFGYSVAVENNKIVVGAYGDDDNGSSSGSVYVYNLDGTGEVKITASDGAIGDDFGYSVAIGNDKIVVGAYDESSTGAVYVYNLDGTGEVKITASDGAADDDFGISVAVGSNKIVVGAYGDDDNGSSSGSAYIYDLDGTNEVKITASDGAASDQFGVSVAVENNKIVVGAFADGSTSGSVYVYNLDGTGEVKIIASDGANFDSFGYSVAVENNKIVVGAYGDDDNGSSSGSVYVHTITDSNTGITTSIFPDGTNGEYFTVTEYVGVNTFKTNVGITSIRHTYDSGGTVEKYNNYATTYTQAIDSTRRNKKYLYNQFSNFDRVIVGTGWCTGVGNSISYLSGITTSAIGAGSSSGVVGIITGINLDTFRCSRDVRDILKAVCYDITRGGSSKVVAAGKTYFDETLAQVGISSFAAATLNNSPIDEVTQTIRAVDYAQDIVRCVINNVTWGGVSIGYTTPIYSIDYSSSTGIATITTRHDHDLSKDDGVEITGLGFTCVPESLSTEGVNILTETYDSTTGIVTFETSTAHGLKSGQGITFENLRAGTDGGSLAVPQAFIGNEDRKLIVDDTPSTTTFVARIGKNRTGGLTINYNTEQTKVFRRYTPSVGINSAVYDRLTGLTTIGFSDPVGTDSSDNDPAYIENDGTVRLEELVFQCDSGGGLSTQFFPSGALGYDFPVEKVGGDRYQDSANLIAGNKLEITDKALANIAIVHPDFFFPGDSSITTTSRYKDAYRLIQQNKGEIVGTAWTTMVTEYPALSGTEDKCKRDLNYLVDAVSTDIFTSGNNYSIAFAKKYFDASGNFLTNGLDGEEVQSILAFDTARDQMKLAIANQLSTKDTTVSGGSSYFGDGSPAIGNSETYSCSDVQASIDNLVGIATEAIESENLNVINGLTINYGNFPGGEFKCRRDIAYVVDSLIDDLRTDSNKNIRETTRKYFDAVGNPISGGLIGEESESVTAFSSIAAYSKLAINNVLNYRDTTITADPAVGVNTDPLGCADIRSSIDSLIGIVTTHVGAGNLNNFPTLSIASSITVNAGVSTLDHTYIGGGRAFVGITTTVFPDGTFGNIFNVDSIVGPTTFTTNFGPTEISHTYADNTGNILKFQPFTKNSDYAGGQIKDESIQYDPRVNSNTSPAGCKNVQSAIDTVIGIVTSIVGGGITAIQSPVNPTGITTRFEGYNGAGYNPAEGEDADTNFSPGCGQIFKGPYVRNCTNFIFDSIGLKIDGFAAEPGDEDEIGVQGSMSVDSYTQYNQRGIGVSITNGSYAQLVSIFTICCDEAIVTASGGQCDLTNSNSSFGRIGLISNGISDATTKSIYRQTGKVVNAAAANDITLEVSGLGTQRPYDGQVYYIDKLYYSLNTITVTNGGSGYNTANDAIITIDAPTGPNGITAQAIPTVENGTVTEVTLINTGTQYETRTPNVTIAAPDSGVTATAEVTKTDPLYYKVASATFPRAGVSTITSVQGLNNDVSVGSTVYLSRQSLQITSSHSFEYVGAGNDIFTARPGVGGVTIQENEVVKEEGGEVIYTSTDQAGNFRIGDGVTINQASGTITGRTYLKSLFNNVTPFILALGD